MFGSSSSSSTHRRALGRPRTRRRWSSDAPCGTASPVVRDVDNINNNNNNNNENNINNINNNNIDNNNNNNDNDNSNNKNTSNLPPLIINPP